jgi:hypothetical protein
MGRIQRGSSGLGAVALAVLLTASLASGQSVPSASSTTPQTVVDVLHQLSDKADVIFAGQVVAIRRPDASVVEVEFRVDQAILGCTVGTPYILREWAGLWEGETQRYRVGQNLLMLLHAPSAAGISSPVGGLDGAIPIRQGGGAASPLADGATPRQPPFVDLRWLGAKLPRSVSYRNEAATVTKPGNLSAPIRSQLRTTASAAASGSVTNAAPITQMAGNAGSNASSVPAQQASVNAVMGMLTSWQKAQHGAP